MRLRVMTFNLLNATPRGRGSDWPLRLAPAAALIRDCDPDVVGVQEATADQLRDLAEALPEYEVVPGPVSGRSRLPAAGLAAVPVGLAVAGWLRRGKPGPLRRAASWGLLAASLAPAAGAAGSLWLNGTLTDEGEHCALLFRRDRLALEGTDAFWLSPAPDRPHSVLPGSWLPRVVHALALRHLGGEGAVTVYNAHVDFLPWAWSRSGEALRRRMDTGWAGRPQVLVGDFNAPDGSGLYRVLGSGGAAPGLQDAWETAECRAGPAATYHANTGTGRWPGRVDRLFVRPAARVLRAETLTRRADGVWPSDHFPVVAHLEWPDEG